MFIILNNTLLIFSYSNKMGNTHKNLIFQIYFLNRKYLLENNLILSNKEKYYIGIVS